MKLEGLTVLYSFRKLLLRVIQKQYRHCLHLLDSEMPVKLWCYVKGHISMKKQTIFCGGVFKADMYLTERKT